MVNKIIKDNAIVDNEWQIITDGALTELPPGKIAISIANWNKFAESANQRNILPGLSIQPDDDLGSFADSYMKLPFIAVSFPAFTDGRGFSIASLLRERHGFKGELRAKGHFIRDQLYYLKRCGFNSFQFDGPVDLEAAIRSLNDFSNDYQTSISQALPLFRRRAG